MPQDSYTLIEEWGNQLGFKSDLGLVLSVKCCVEAQGYVTLAYFNLGALG